MATKTWKIGEYAKGGIITVETTKTKVIVIGKEWDYSQGSNRSSNQSNAKEWIRVEIDVKSNGARRKVDTFLNDLTTYYYADEILKWIETKVEFINHYW